MNAPRAERSRTPAARLPLNLALAAAACACLLFGGAVQFRISAAERAERQRRINNMTADQRDVLKAQFERWKKLSDSERERWRRFEGRLNEDKSGGLRQTLQSYIDWLGTLPASERVKLQREENFARRVVLIQGLMKFQGQRAEWISTVRLPRIPRDDKNLLSLTDFEKALKAMQEYLKDKRPEGLDPRIPDFRGGKETDLGRAARLLPMAGFALALEKPFGAGALEAAAEAVEDAEIKSSLKKPAALRTHRMYLLLVRTLAAEIGQKVPDSDTPGGQQELGNFFTKLPEREQEELLRSRPEDFWPSFEWRYAMSNGVPWLSRGLAVLVRDATWDAPWPKSAVDLLKNPFQAWGPNRGEGPNRRGKRPSLDNLP